jgi:hypothetical protein
MQQLKIRGSQETLEKFRCEYEAMLTVLTARIASAQDLEDWETIRSQTKSLTLIAKRGVYEAGLLRK